MVVGVVREVVLPVVAGIAVVLFAGAVVFMVGEDKIMEFFGAEENSILIGNATVKVSVADTDAERIQGLSGRSGLGDNEGLLFVFPESDYHGIWMKDMRFPIDIIWIDENFEVISIKDNVYPDSYPEIFEPNRPARFVLETSALFTTYFSIHVGDKVRIPDHLLPEDLKNN